MATTTKMGTDLQTEKLDLIALLAKVDDRELVGAIAELMRRRGVGEASDITEAEWSEAERLGAPPSLTVDDLVARARVSEADIAAGRLHTTEEVEAMIDAAAGVSDGGEAART